jgi:pimeloyl-ACP methyl ester carboxylesterase
MAVFRQGDRDLHYELRGDGEPVLLVHGLGSSGSDWDCQLPVLEPRFRVIMPDLPGCGSSGMAGTGYSIGGFAIELWSLLDSLGIKRPNIVGFSLGGAVALEMALQRPDSVPRLVLINSLASYRIDHWRKWLEARVPAMLVRLLGMPRVARLMAARVLPEPWQQPIRDLAVSVVGAVPASTYLGMAIALERWSATDRLDRLRSRTLLIAAEHDYTPLGEKRALALKMHASIVVVRGSRHGTPFDSIAVTNACLIALLTDQPLPDIDTCVRDHGPGVFTSRLADRELVRSGYPDLNIIPLADTTGA